MSIVRELLIKIGFVTNKQTQTAVNKTVTQTKKNLQATSKAAQSATKTSTKAQKSLFAVGKRMLLGWTAALFAVKKFFNFFNNVAIKVLDNDILARSIGLAREELAALNSEARNFGFKENQFSGILGVLDKMNRDVRNGVTSFHKLNQQLRINISPEGTALDTLRTILEGVSKLDTEKSRIDFLNDLFPGMGVQLSDLSQDLDNFYSNVAKSTQRNKNSVVDIETFKNFTKEINRFTEIFKRLIETITNEFLPSLTFILETINDVLNIFQATYNLIRRLVTGDFEAIKESFKPTFNTIKEYGQPAFDFLKQGVIDATQYFLPNPSFGMTPVNVSLNNTIQVPYGTTAEQAVAITSQVENQIAYAMNRVFINIQNNNPLVEA